MGIFKRRQEHPSPQTRTTAGPRRSFFCGTDDRGPFITVCSANGAGRCRCGCEAVHQAFEDEIRSHGLKVRLAKMKTGCQGTCPYGPLAGFPGGGFFYHRMTPERAQEAVSETIARGHILFDLLHLDPLQSISGRILYDHGSEFMAFLDESHCAVQAAKYFLDFDKGVSCGKCTPCRAGFVYLREIIDAIAQGGGQAGDIQSMLAIMAAMRQAAFCEYAGRGSGPLALLLKHFRVEFDLHIEQKACPAGGCSNLSRTGMTG